MSDENPTKNERCRSRCDDTFLDCTARKFSGCIEAYRVCKEKCEMK